MPCARRPIVSYFEIGTGLTANHAHTAMTGVYGMLAAGLAVFCLRYLVPEKRWSNRAARISFWSLNLGLAWMAFASLFPLGVLQLYRSVADGYWQAGTLDYLGNSANTVLEWVRLPGDVLLILGGALPLLWLAFRAIAGRKKVALGRRLRRDAVRRAGCGARRGLITGRRRAEGAVAAVGVASACLGAGRQPAIHDLDCHESQPIIGGRGPRGRRRRGCPRRLAHEVLRLTPDDPHGEAAGTLPVAEGRLIAGRYRVERRLGSGGMAEVFLARDATLGRLVAVKVLHERFADDEQFVARFHREARAAAALNHPNVVAVHDRGVSAGSSYIVMEYVPGETVKELVQRAGRLSPAAARSIELELLAALQAAHGSGIVHRDVTARNVLLTEDGRAKVTDFGIARFGSSTLTSAGVVMGTSRYLSPEQARGEPTDERSDLYSAGVVLFEMLTGRLPFEGNNDIAIALRHANEPAPAATALVPDLPPALDALVSRALRKDPAQRFQTAREFAAALTAIDLVADPAVSTAVGTLGSTAATLVAPSGAGAATGVHRPRRRLWAVLAALVALAAVLAGVLAYQAYVDPAVAMPSVVGMREGPGGSELRNEGFRVRSTGGYSDAYATGVVMAQRPAAGASVKKGLRVHVVVSRGLLHPAVLSVVGETSSGATAALRAQSFVPRGLTEHSNGVPPGHVIRQSPVAGAPLLRGGPVRYWVSSGPRMVPVPDVVGASEGSAADALRAAGFSVTIGTSGGRDGLLGDVVGQEPSAGSSALWGSRVTIWLASLKHRGTPKAHGSEGNAGGGEGNAP